MATGPSRNQMKVTSKVPQRFAGVTLLNYLVQRFSYLSESAWQELLRDGRISCNGACCDGSETVDTGDVIDCDLPNFEPPQVNYAYSIIYADADLLAINKPAGLRVHSGGRFVTANLIYHLRHLHQPPYPEVNLVNRLDADTSGLVLLARNKPALTNLMQQFADGLVKKTYLAVVAGCPDPSEGTIELPIGPVQEAAVPRFWINADYGKPAVTHYRTLQRLRPDYSLLELQPKTGRTHQLRVHLAAIGHPIAGDALYTMSDADYLDWRRNLSPKAGLQRQALHSQQLTVVHPTQKMSLTLTAPLASDIEQFFQCATDLV
jgi:23S rRNA pseudouridine1911/1915/1917 synthase